MRIFPADRRLGSPSGGTPARADVHRPHAPGLVRSIAQGNNGKPATVGSEYDLTAYERAFKKELPGPAPLQRVPPPPSVARPIDPTDPCGPGEFMFAFWNLQHLFDPQTRVSLGNLLFTEDSPLGYGDEALEHRIRTIARSVHRLAGGKGPHVLGVAEIGNNRVARLLCQALGPEWHYEMPHTSISGPHRLALFSRLPTKDVDVYSVVTTIKTRLGIRKTVAAPRSILKVGVRLGPHTVPVEVVHNPAAGGPQVFKVRLAAARILRHLMLRTNALALGDFNEDFGGPSWGAAGMNTAPSCKTARREGQLYDLMDGLRAYPRGVQVGTLRRRDGTWYTPDHIITTPALLGNGPVRIIEHSTVVYIDPELALPDGAPRPAFVTGDDGEVRLDPTGGSDHALVAVRLQASPSVKP